MHRSFCGRLGAIAGLVMIRAFEGIGATASPADWEADLDLGIPKWDKSAIIRAQAGYKDNVTLANRQPDSSSFVATGLELMLFRLPIDDTQFHFFVFGEDIRYLETESVHKEQSLISQAQLKRKFSPRWTGVFSAQYLYQDQVLDLSTEEETRAVQVQGHSLAARPALRWELHPEAWFEGEWNLSRQWFRQPLDDYWEGGPKISLGHPYGHQSEAVLSYEFNRRIYDERLQTDRFGVRQPGHSLNYNQHEVALAIRHHWDARRRWRTVTRVAYERNLDNGAGYFDYRRWQFTQQLRFRAASWEARVQAKVSRYDYPVQTVDPAAASNRQRTDLSVNLRAEKNLSRRLKLFGDYLFEKALSNDQFEPYTVNTVLGGAEWEF